MKKTILSLSLLITGTIFAYNPSIELRTKKALQISKTNITESVACRVSCSATATNTETGESRTFYASATDELCGVASVTCQTKAFAKALSYVNSQ